MYIADLHVHSKYAMATSRDCDLPHLDLWARRKGVHLVGTGDFTHPAWRQSLRESLVPAGDGVYALIKALTLPAETAGEGSAPLFLVSGEISCIYRKDGKTRKAHHLILLPSLSDAERLSRRLEAVGNLHSDGRPILGMDSRDLLSLTLDVCPEALFIPAHIWTPHFSVLGAFSAFASIEECFSDLSGQIHALETGLSSDPAMNRRVSRLDRFFLVSGSDAHSPGKLGREATIFDGTPSYPALFRALVSGAGLLGTLEFFPEEGKYYLDGHRACGVSLAPAETEALQGRCPVCGKKLTVGVAHRVHALADRPEPLAVTPPFTRLLPLPELIAEAVGVSAASKTVRRLYDQALRVLGPELTILRETPVADIERVAGPRVARGVQKLRVGRATLIPGYDGRFGRVLLLD